MASVVVIGAGISGLATAYHVQEALPTVEVTVLEASARPGGTIGTERQQGYQLETGPNGFLDDRPGTMDLCRKLGLDRDLIPANEMAARRFLLCHDRLMRLPTGMGSFLTFPGLSWSAKWGLLRERWRRSPIPADESVHDFAVRRVGPEVAETFADAFVTGIYAGDPKVLSLPAAFPRLARAERERGSVTAGLKHLAAERRQQARQRGEPRPGKPKLWSFPTGMRLLVDILALRLRRPPLFQSPARLVHRTSDAAGRPQWEVLGADQRRWVADAVVLASPAHRQAAMVADLDHDLADTLLQIPYAPIAVVGLGYRREDVPARFLGFGYIAPQRLRRDVLGAQFCSVIFPERAPEGHILLRAMCGGWNRRDVMTWDDDRLGMAVRLELRRTLGIHGLPTFQHIVRWDPAIPQYTMGHHDRVAAIEAHAARHPGLFLTGNAFHGVALNDCTEQAARVACRVVDFLAGCS